jgi:ribosomal protein S18 acetylase RimI-like enzyme
LSGLVIRRAGPDDGPALWAILEPVIRAGETYALPRDMGADAALDYWLSAEKQTFIAERDGIALGTYYLRPNQPGGGAHVANAGFMTTPAARGQGIARAMARDALARARAAGYRAMQFNFVIATNTGAIALWESLGFRTLCRLPLAFDHPHAGLVDALVMFQELQPAP